MCFTSILTVHRMALITAGYVYTTMSGNERGEETFIAKVGQGWLFTIYEPVRESLGLEMGDRLRVTVRIEGRKNKRREETYLAKVYPGSGWRICIYEPVREILGLEVGDRVRVTIRKEESPKEGE